MGRKKTHGNRVVRKNTSIPATPVSTPREVRDFGLLKIRGGRTKQASAILKENDIVANFARMSNERKIQIVQGTNIDQMRELSKYFIQTNGMYSRAVRHLSDIYRFDYMVYPNLDLDIELNDSDNKKILKKYNALLEHFEASSLPLMLRRWATQVCAEGVYYGYVCDDIADKIVIQDLPVAYCRSRFLHRGIPLIEFNVQYFNRVTSDLHYREQLLNLFPDEFKIGYLRFQDGQLPPESQGDEAGWIMLDIRRAFKFNFNDNDIPPFLHAIPSIIELGEVQDLEKEKLLQNLQKILVQEFELNKNGELPFLIPELQTLNQNAVEMVGDAVGVSVLSTPAKVHLEDLSPSSGKESKDSVDAAENSVYNDFGISMNLFNTDGNLALEKSVIIDESYVKPLLLQFERFLNAYIDWKFNKKDLSFRLKILETTTFNHKDLSNSYKDLTKIGFSRFLPMVALGHSPKEVSSLVKLEQQIMQLDNWMLPPFSSNTMSSDTWSDIKTLQQIGGGIGDGGKSETGKTGREPLPPDQKSDKTIANQASLS